LTNLKDRIENNLVLVILGVVLAGFIAGISSFSFIASQAEKQNKPSITWLKITGISSIDNREVRVLLTANGRPFSYPSSSVWITSKPSSGDEQFPLLGITGLPVVEFRVVENKGGGTTNDFKGSISAYNVPSIPYDGQYEVFDSSGKIARINFEVFKAQLE